MSIIPFTPSSKEHGPSPDGALRRLNVINDGTNNVLRVIAPAVVHDNLPPAVQPSQAPTEVLMPSRDAVSFMPPHESTQHVMTDERQNPQAPVVHQTPVTESFSQVKTVDKLGQLFPLANEGMASVQDGNDQQARADQAQALIDTLYEEIYREDGGYRNPLDGLTGGTSS